MAHSPEQIAADAERLRDHRCPECNTSFKDMKRVAIEGHIAHEFPHGELVEHMVTDYGRRYRALRAYLVERFREVN